MTTTNALRRVAKFYKTTVVVAANTIILIVVSNIILLIVDRIKDGNVNAIYRLYPDVQWTDVYPHLDETSIDALLTESSTLPLAYAPYTQYREVPIDGRYFTVSEHGFRHSGNQKPWPPDPRNFNVFLFGGSTTFGYGVANAETLASHFQTSLGDFVAANVAVYNFGRAGYRSTQERLLYEQLLMDGHVPDLSVFVDGLNDFAHYEPLFTKNLTDKFANWNRGPGTALAASIVDAIPELPMVRLVGFLQNMLPSTPAGNGSARQSGSNMEYIRRVVALYLENKKLVEAAAEVYSTSAIFVVQPVPMYQYALEYHLFAEGGFTHPNRHTADGYAYLRQLVESTDMGSRFLWLADMQRDLHEPLYVDKIHYSTKMNALIAAELAHQLDERDLVSSPVGVGQ